MALQAGFQLTGTVQGTYIVLGTMREVRLGAQLQGDLAQVSELGVMKVHGDWRERAFSPVVISGRLFPRVSQETIEAMKRMESEIWIALLPENVWAECGEDDFRYIQGNQPGEQIMITIMCAGVKDETLINTPRLSTKKFLFPVVTVPNGTEEQAREDLRKESIKELTQYFLSFLDGRVKEHYVVKSA